MKKWILSAVTGVWCASALAGGNEAVHQIVNQYESLSVRYEASVLEGDYRRAYLAAKEQLAMDPSDSLAYLRLAIAAQHMPVDGQKLIAEYSHSVSEADRFQRQVKSLANSLLAGKEPQD